MDALSIVLTAIVAGVGAYVGSYLKKKGENLATHEDVDKLVAQVAAVTQATKEIEAKISTDVWERQRSWEARRDVLFEVVKELASVQHAVSDVTSAFDTFAGAKIAASEDDKWHELLAQKTEALSKAQLDFEKARILASLVADSELDLSLTNVNLTLTSLAVSGMTQDATNTPTTLELMGQISGILRLVRERLGFVE